MKKLLYLLLFSLFALSCETDKQVNNTLPDRVEITADSKSIENDGYEGDLPSWGVGIGGSYYTEYSFEVGDQVRILSDGGVDVVMTATASGKTGIKFEGDFKPLLATDTYYALYPATLDMVDGKVIVDVDKLNQDGTASHAAVLAAMSENVTGDKIHFDFKPINVILHVGIDNGGVMMQKATFDIHPNNYTGYYYDIRTGESTPIVESGSEATPLQFTMAPGIKEEFFISLPPYKRSEGDLVAMKVEGVDGSSAVKKFDMNELKAGYSYTTIVNWQKHALYGIFPQGVGASYIDSYVVSDHLEEIRCLIVPEGYETLTALEIFEHGEAVNGGSASERISKHKFEELTEDTTYVILAAGRYTNDEGEKCYLSAKSEPITTVALDSYVTVNLFSYSRTAHAYIYGYGYNYKTDEMHALLSTDDTLTDAKAIYDAGEKIIWSYNNHSREPYYVSYLAEYEKLVPSTKYTLYAVGNKGGYYQMEKVSFVTSALEINARVLKVTEDYIWCRADHTGYDEIRFYFSEDPNLTDAKAIFDMGEVANSTKSGSNGVYLQTHYLMGDYIQEMKYNTTYTIYTVGKYNDGDSYGLASTEVTTTGCDPKVVCGARSSYTFYKNHNFGVANEMHTAAIALGAYVEGPNGSGAPTYAYSTYEGIWDKDIVSAGVEVYTPGTSDVINVPLPFADGYIGANSGAYIGYEEIDLGTYAARAYILVDDGTMIYSDEIILHVTGVPYDTENGACHGFYTTDSINWLDMYTDEQHKFYWEECNNGDKSGVVAWMGHDGVTLQSNLKAPRWPQILSPKFYIPEPFYVQGYMKALQASGIDPVTVSLSQSTEMGGDYEVNGEQEQMVALDLYFLKTRSATSKPVKMTDEYPCFQIEHESALPLPTTCIERLKIEYCEAP